MKKCKNCLVGYDYILWDYISYKEYIHEKDWFKKKESIIWFNYCPKCGHKISGVKI